MGKPVTVDSDDLQALLFSTGSIKAIEGALQQRSEDPLVKMAAPNLTIAHDRLSAEWRRAVREQGLKPSDGPLTEADKAKLREFYAVDEDIAIRIRLIYGTAAARRPDGFEGLRKRGMAEFGSVFEFIKWGDSQEQTSRDQMIWVVRLTARGRSALAELIGFDPEH